MKDPLSFLLLTASVCIAFSLAVAWSLSAVRYLKIAAICKIFPADRHLAKAHVDYLLMAVLLYVFYLLFKRLDIMPPLILILSMCIGSLLNPFGFFVLAIHPDISQSPLSVFGITMTTGFLLTTCGYIGAALLVGMTVVTP